MKQTPITFPYFGVTGNIAQKDEKTPKFYDQLVLNMASTTDEGVYSPAESFTLQGAPAIMALRDALNAVYPPDGEKR
jgi:hypothetical protein